MARAFQRRTSILEGAQVTQMAVLSRPDKLLWGRGERQGGTLKENNGNVVEGVETSCVGSV